MIPKKKRVYTLIEKTLSYFQNLMIRDEEDVYGYKFLYNQLENIRQRLLRKNEILLVTDNLPLLKEEIEKLKLYTEKGRQIDTFNLFFDMTGVEEGKICFKCCSKELYEKNRENFDNVMFVQDEEPGDKGFVEEKEKQIMRMETVNSRFFINKLKEFYLDLEYAKTEKCLEDFKKNLKQKKAELETYAIQLTDTVEETEDALICFKDEIEELLRINKKMLALELSNRIHSIPSNKSNEDFQDFVKDYNRKAIDVCDEISYRYETDLNRQMKKVKEKHSTIKSANHLLNNSMEIEIQDIHYTAALKSAGFKAFWRFLKTSLKQNGLMNISLYCIIILCCIIIFQLPIKRSMFGFNYTLIGLGNPVQLFDQTDLTKVSNDVMENPVKVGRLGFSMFSVCLIIIFVALLVLFIANWELFKLVSRLERRTLSEKLMKKWHSRNKIQFFREQFDESYEKSTLEDLSEIVRNNRDRIKRIKDKVFENTNEPILFIKDVEMEIQKIDTEVYYE